MFKLIKKLNKKQILYIFICIIFIVGQVYLDLKLPDYMQSITALLQSEVTTLKDILIPGSKMLLCALLSLIGAFITGYFSSLVATSFSRDLRYEIFSKVGLFSNEEMKKFMTSSLITRTTNDVTQVQFFLAMGLQLIIKAPIMAVWAIIKIVNKNFTWSIVTAGAIGVLLIMITILIVFALPKFKIIQKLTDNLNRITRENLIGIRVVRAFNAENYQQEKFDNANNDLTKTQTFVGKLMSIMNPGMNFIMSMLTLTIYFVGAYMINEANMLEKVDLFSNMIVFSSYAMQVVMSFVMLTMIFIIYPRASVSAKRIIEVLDTDETIKDGSILEGKEIGTVEFKNVSFKYPDAEDYMLYNISFKAKKGETIAFIGKTGSGKSTLINLVPRFYDATEGEVLVDGVNVKDYKLEKLYDKLGYIKQKAIMFSGTVKDNLSLGHKDNKKPTDEKIANALKISKSHEFVSKMPNGVNSHVARGGTNVSGGQKQRLSIARAIARDPEILIFDDTFSALDYKTDLALRKEIKNKMSDKTCLIVASRIGTIKDADKIIVLDEGKCVGMGKHEELLKNCKLYKEIALSQLSLKELEHE
ncbi:MAG: ABC transporter ATP-binding protein [bacterium]|nr:ABC transporter ATP-binding protein [bacterium]